VWSAACSVVRDGLSRSALRYGSVVDTVKVTITCTDCQLDGRVSPRALAHVHVFDDDTYVATVAPAFKGRGPSSMTLARDRVPGSRSGVWTVVDPGEQITRPCGRTHSGRKGSVVIDDDAVGAALRRAGLDPSRVRRLAYGEIPSAWNIDGGG
jgi:hypothetical protein